MLKKLFEKIISFILFNKYAKYIKYMKFFYIKTFVLDFLTIKNMKDLKKQNFKF